MAHKNWILFHFARSEFFQFHHQFSCKQTSHVFCGFCTLIYMRCDICYQEFRIIEQFSSWHFLHGNESLFPSEKPGENQLKFHFLFSFSYCHKVKLLDFVSFICAFIKPFYKRKTLKKNFTFQVLFFGHTLEYFWKHCAKILILFRKIDMRFF